jgi:hypothetical protein
MPQLRLSEEHSSESACQQQEEQNDEDDSAQATPDPWATHVETASAEHQQKNKQQHQQAHSTPFRFPVIVITMFVTI